MSTVIIFVSRPGNTKLGAPWHISGCQVQEIETTSAGTGTSQGSSGRALKEFGPNTFEIMQEIIAQRNAALRTGGSSAANGPRWVLQEVLHGCLGAIPGNTFSFSVRLENAGTARDEKAVLPGY